MKKDVSFALVHAVEVELEIYAIHMPFKLNAIVGTYGQLRSRKPIRPVYLHELTSRFE